MKEARIDAILQSITKTLLVYLPDQAVDPATFYEENLTRRDEIGKTNGNLKRKRSRKCVYNKRLVSSRCFSSSF